MLPSCEEQTEYRPDRTTGRFIAAIGGVKGGAQTRQIEATHSSRKQRPKESFHNLLRHIAYRSADGARSQTQTVHSSTSRVRWCHLHSMSRVDSPNEFCRSANDHPSRLFLPRASRLRDRLRSSSLHLAHLSLMTVSKNSKVRTDAWNIASRWCHAKGNGWAIIDQLGVGGTAPVFEVQSPHGLRALKIYDEKFSSGQLGDIEQQRIEQLLGLQNHRCPSLVNVFEGGTTDDRHYLLMSRAPGTELKKRLPEVPRSSIRGILHDVASACLFLQGRDICHRDIKAANVCVSDDFSHATLLDISVIRAIHDPVGAGTDYDGQLPVLATTRYSPPEYLFRLEEPGPALWHALNVYQLGALLHDLIVGTPLYHVEYQQCEMNRYRFAWVVATQVPSIDAADIDDDLRFLAHRALDKDWKRRSALRIEDFLNEATSRKKNAFHLLGLYRDPVDQAAQDFPRNRVRLDEISRALEEHLIEYFRAAGVTTTHQVLPGPKGDNSRIIELKWNAIDDLRSTATVALRFTLCLLVNGPDKRLGVTVVLSREASGETKSVDIDLPEIGDNEQSSTTLANQCEAAFASLAIELSHTDNINP